MNKFIYVHEVGAYHPIMFENNYKRNDERNTRKYDV